MRKRLLRQLEQRNQLHFDITTVAFGRGMSHLSITEKLAPTETGADRKQLVIFRGARTYGKDEEIRRKRSIAFRPMFDQRSLSYRVDAMPDQMEVQTSFGNAQIVFDGPDSIRLRGSGIALRFFIKMGYREGAVLKADGTCQINQVISGETLFVPIKGRLDYEGEWLWERRAQSDVLIDILPDDNGEFEFALYTAPHGVTVPPQFRAFEDCRAESAADFEAWLVKYPPVPRQYMRLKQLCAYCIRICYVKPLGLMKAPGVQFMKPTASGIFSWHQAYHAMTLTEDIDSSVEMMLNFFNYQDEYGELPDIYCDLFNNTLATKPPFHGFSMLYIIERAGDRLTREHCERLYAPLCKLCGFWLGLRDTDNDGVPQYNHGCESGIDNSDMFRKGVPVETPDIIAYVILLEEALGILARRLGKTEEAEAWYGKSVKLTDTLIKEFWNGKRFVARLSTTHRIVETQELEAYMPVMLGSRIPKQIMDKMLEDLTDPEKYYTPIGFRSNPKQYKDGKAVPGFIGGFAQVKMLPALWQAGEKELARTLIAGYCSKSAEKVPAFGLMEFPPEGGADFNSAFWSPGGELNSLAAAMFLCLAGFLEEISHEQ